MIKGVRSARGKTKQNLLQPLSCLDMVVYDTSKDSLNYIKELHPRGAIPPADAVHNAMVFFMTEVLYKALKDDEPMPDLWDYIESVYILDESVRLADFPIYFLLQVARHLGVEPLDDMSPHSPYFDLQEGHYVAMQSETTLSAMLSESIHLYMCWQGSADSQVRKHLLDALLVYYQLHLNGFQQLKSREVLHTVLKYK